MKKKGPGAWVQAPMMQRADKAAPPILMPPLDKSFFLLIGNLVAQWAVMEQHLNILLRALLTKNKTSVPNWHKRTFEKRFELLRAEWVKFSGDSKTLASFLNPTYQKIRAAKILRDGIAHKEIVFGIGTDGNHCIQFYNYSRAKQKSKKYYTVDFREAIRCALEASGELYWITDAGSVWPLPSQDTQTLRSLPDMDRYRFPT